MARVCLVKNREDDPFPIGGVLLKAGDLASVLVQDDDVLVRINRAGLQVLQRARELDRRDGQVTPIENTSPDYFLAMQQRSTTLVYERQPDVDGPAQEVAKRYTGLFAPPE